MSTDQPFLVRHADIVFSLKTFAAAMLALVIALAILLDDWARRKCQRRIKIHQKIRLAPVLI
jgi:hypothetical protein